MVETTFKITSLAEFNEGLIDRIRTFINGSDVEITVNIRSKSKIRLTESQIETNRRIEQAMHEAERGENMITFTSQEYEALIQKLDAK
jgi:predicted metalloprotease with PDZ domain